MYLKYIINPYGYNQILHVLFNREWGHYMYGICVKIFIRNRYNVIFQRATQWPRYYWLTTYRAGAAVVSTITIINPLGPLMTNINFFLIIINQNLGGKNWYSDHLGENALIFYQILSTNSLRKMADQQSTQGWKIYMSIWA